MVVTLVYLAAQIRQNSALLRSHATSFRTAALDENSRSMRADDQEQWQLAQPLIRLFLSQPGFREVWNLKSNRSFQLRLGTVPALNSGVSANRGGVVACS